MRSFALFFCVLAGCSGPTAGPDGIAAGVIPSGSTQVIVVRKAADKPIMLTAWEYDGGWKAALGPMPCTIGRTGFAVAGEKKEGDGHTPTGVYGIGLAFGHEKKVDAKLDFKDVGPDDFWVDDPDSPQYNRWVHGKPAAKSFEKLRIDAYKFAAVIEYNTNPVEPGKGSAIFLHIWSGADKPTAGCIAVEEKKMVKLLGWLDKGRKPVIALNP